METSGSHVPSRVRRHALSNSGNERIVSVEISQTVLMESSWRRSSPSKPTTTFVSKSLLSKLSLSSRRFRVGSDAPRCRLESSRRCPIVRLRFLIGVPLASNPYEIRLLSRSPETV